MPVWSDFKLRRDNHVYAKGNVRCFEKRSQRLLPYQTRLFCEKTKMMLWDKSLYLLTPDEFNKLPDGFALESIFGATVIKGVDYIDDDTRAGHLAYGIRDIHNHPAKDDILLFLLKI